MTSLCTDRRLPNTRIAERLITVSRAETKLLEMVVTSNIDTSFGFPRAPSAPAKDSLRNRSSNDENIVLTFKKIAGDLQRFPLLGCEISHCGTAQTSITFHASAWLEVNKLSMERYKCARVANLPQIKALQRDESSSSPSLCFLFILGRFAR